jgi:hypothetical protein
MALSGGLVPATRSNPPSTSRAGSGSEPRNDRPPAGTTAATPRKPATRPGWPASRPAPTTPPIECATTVKVRHGAAPAT